MRPIRPVAAVALLAGVAALTVACERANSGLADALDAVRGTEHVASATAVSYDDPSQGKFVRFTLDKALPDATVLETVRSIQRTLDDYDDRPDLEADIDRFRASVYPGTAGNDNLDVTRALWLRADGRATSRRDAYASTVSSRPVVIAPAADVARLALDYEARFGPTDTRGTQAVESADGTVGVQWSTIPSIEAGLDRAATRRLAALQRSYPGTTGWIACDGGPTCRGAINLPADVDPARVPALARPSLFSEPPVLGWGRFRADANGFAEDLAAPGVRRQVAGLSAVPGVVEVQRFAVVVRDGTAFDRVLALVRRAYPDVRIQLRRAPVLYDYPTGPVFELRPGRGDGPAVALFRTIAGLDGVRSADVTPGARTAQLTIASDIDAGQLRTALDAVADLPASYTSTQVFAEVPGGYGRPATRAVGALDADGLTPPTVAAAPKRLAQRVATTWRAALAAR